MIKLFSLKQQKKDAEAAGVTGKKTSASQLRITKGLLLLLLLLLLLCALHVSPLLADHNELQLPTTCELEFDDPDDLLNVSFQSGPLCMFFSPHPLRFHAVPHGHEAE